jgi:hypothetical protein
MVWIDYNYFTEKWVNRAERPEGQASIEMVDKFISLWIAFNSWMRGEFGENKSDRALLNKAKLSSTLIPKFEELKRDSPSYTTALDKLKDYTVADMRDIYPEISYDGSFGSLIEVIYRTRCNLIHGRKDPEQEQKDRELINLSFELLLPIVKGLVQT